VKKENRENLCQGYLADQQLYSLLQKVDAELAEKFRQGGCLKCRVGVLHRSDYKRKPRGGLKKDEEIYRDSFCCNKDTCRKRHTPPSVRFLGRKVYWGFIVALLSAMRHGIKPQRLKVLREAVGVDYRTVERWRHWWLETFVQSPFWKAARSRFSPPLSQQTLPLSLCEVFDIQRRDRLLELLKFLGPITTTSLSQEHTI
jgi:hypothetical protein